MFWKLQENVVRDSDLELLISFIRETSRFTQFYRVKEFEEAFAEWQGCKYSVFVNSGSSANLALISAIKDLHKLRDGDEVIVPAVTWPTTITPVIQLGLKPVFVDVNLTDLSCDYDQIERKITSRTRVIFVAHLLGFPSDVSRIQELARERGILVVEDCCESQGASRDGIKVGNLGYAGTFSFYWGHHMTTVEGGMLCTSNEDLYKSALLKRSHGLARELPAEYHPALKAQHPDIDFNFLFLTDGFNLRNTEFNAVLGLAQLRSMDDFIRTRNHNYASFLDMCQQYPEDLITLDGNGMSSFALPFLFRSQERKNGFERCIQAAGIESRSLISGNLLRQPFLRSYCRPGDYQNAEFLHTNAFYIGNNQFVDDERLSVLSGLLAEFFGPVASHG